MRTAFINALLEQASRNEKIFLIVGDLGYSVVEPFAERFPKRFLNAGVAEQSMTGIAAGLAREGYHVFTYSIANFPTLRCLEQIRNDVCYHNLPVTIVSVGAGLAYGNLGYSHHAVQDIGCLRTMPNCTVLSPADPGEAAQCLNYLCENPGPSYLRLGKAGEETLHDKTFAVRKPILLAGEEDADVAIIGTGSILIEGFRARDSLSGVLDLAVYSMPWISPLEPSCLDVLWRHRRLITLEEHVAAGGIGEMIRSHRPNCTEVRSIHLKSELTSSVGSQAYLREKMNMTSKQIIEIATAQ